MRLPFEVHEEVFGIDGKLYTGELRKLGRGRTEEEPWQEDPAGFEGIRWDKSWPSRDLENPHDPEARMAKVMDGSTHLACKAEDAMDFETGSLQEAVK